MKLNNWKLFNLVFWTVNILLVLLVAHFILWNGEPEGYFEIFLAEGFVAQYLVNVGGLFLLIFLMDRISYQSPVTERHTHVPWQKLGRYFTKAFLLPLFLAFPFSYFYFVGFGGHWQWQVYLQRVVPILLLFVLFVNLVLLLRYLLLLLSVVQERVQVRWKVYRYTQISVEVIQGKESSAAGRTDLPMVPDSEDKNVAERSIKVYHHRNEEEVPLEKIVCACIEDRSVRVYLQDKKVCRYPESLSRLTESLHGDPRFFATGSWIINGHYVHEVRDTLTRKKYVYLRFPFEMHFSLPKERVSEFRQWLQEQVQAG